MGRRAAGEGSIHQRSRDGKWCAVLDLGYVKGKRVRRTRTADTQEEAARLLHQLRNEYERGATNIDRRTPLKAWCEEWVAFDVEYRASVGQLRQSTAESYERLVRCHVVPHLGHIKLFDLDARTIQRAYQAMLDDLSPSSVSKVHQILRSMLGAAVRDGILVVNPCARATPPAVPRNEVEPLTLDDAPDRPRGADDEIGFSVSTTKIEPLLLRVDEAAEALALSRTKVYELMASGEPESVNLGRARRVPTEALREFLNESRLHE